MTHERRCTKDTVFTFRCSCDECSRQAAGAWHGLMDRVFKGEITLDEAQTLDRDARHNDGSEIVRYDRAGKWYLEHRPNHPGKARGGAAANG